MTITRFMDTRRKRTPTAKIRQQGNADAAIPSMEEARARLAAARGRPQPWLTQAAFGAADGVPEVIGPETYRKP